MENYTVGTSYLGTLDYGARHYDPRIARWTVPDPMAEKYYGVNAYNYCSNNPIILVDPTGSEILPKSVAEYTNSIPKHSYSKVLEDEYGPYTINAFYDSKDQIVGYSAVKSVIIGKTATTRLDYIMTNESDLSVFADNVSILSVAADLMYANDDLSQGMIAMLSGDISHGLITQWKEALTSPFYCFDILSLINASPLLTEKPLVTFGNNANQVYHAFRHIDKIGLSKSAVEKAIINDINKSYRGFKPQKPNNRVIVVSGDIIQYTAYQRSNNYYNVGRIQINK